MPVITSFCDEFGGFPEAGNPGAALWNLERAIPGLVEDDRCSMEKRPAGRLSG
jgi:hypothetical protein